MRTGQSFLAIGVARFMTLDEFCRRTQSPVVMVKSSRPAKGYGEVTMCTPLSDGVWQSFVQTARHLGVALP